MIFRMLHSLVSGVHAFVVALDRCFRNAWAVETTSGREAAAAAAVENLGYRVEKDFTVMPRVISARRSIQLSWSRQTPRTYLVGGDGVWRYVQTLEEMRAQDVVTIPATDEDRDYDDL